jgi:cardiolipin synthase
LRTEILVDAQEFCARLGEDLAAAKDRAWVQTLSFEGDAAGSWLAGVMHSCPAADRRMIVDSYTRFWLSDRFLFSPRGLSDPVLQAEARATRSMIRGLRAGGVGVRFTAHMGFGLRRLPARDHKKILLIDDHIAYLGGINFSDHNFAWHDLMLRFEDVPVASFLRDDFLATWAGGGDAGRIRFDGIELLSLDGVTNERMLADVLQRIRQARRSVVVHNAYFTFPFCDALREVVGQGVQVTVITPEVNNRAVLKDYMMWESQRSGFSLMLYPERMSHLKAMLIDDECLITGSSNFDWLTYGYQPELLAVITRPETIELFRRRVLDPDLARCTPVRPGADLRRGRRADRVMKLIARVARVPCPRERRPVSGAGVQLLETVRQQ